MFTASPPPPPPKKSMTRTRNSALDIKHPSIIVRFVSRYKRIKVYVSRFKSKKIGKFPVQNMERLIINESRTQKRKLLFWQTKQKAEDLDYKFYWTFNGQIFVRKNEESDKVHIKQRLIKL